MNERIRILYTIPNFDTAGSGDAMLNVIDRLDRDVFEPAVCVLRRGGRDDLEAHDVPLLCETFAIPAKPYSTLPMRAWKASRPFKKHGFEIWHSFHYSDDYTEPLIARMAGAKAWIYTKKNMSWGSRAWRLRSYLATGIAAQNSYMLESFFSNNPARVKLIPPCVDHERFTPEGPKLPLPVGGERLTLGCLAHLLPLKNQMTLIEAMSRTKSSFDLVLAGAPLDEEYAERLRCRVDELGLGRSVHFLGRVEDTPRFLRSLDIFAFCGRTEACPVALLEAMAVGLPCVVTDMPALRDFQADPEPVKVVPQDDGAALASALDELAQDERSRDRLAKAASNYIRRRPDCDEEASQYSALYLEARRG